MSDFSQSACDNHKQSNQLAQPLSSTTTSHLENGTQPHSPRLPVHQVLSEHDANEEPLDSSPTSEDSIDDNDDGWNDFSFEDYDFGPIILSRPEPMWAFIDDRWPIERMRPKEDEFPLSLSTSALLAARAPTSRSKRLVRLFQSIKADVKAKKPFTRPARGIATTTMSRQRPSTQGV